MLLHVHELEGTYFHQPLVPFLEGFQDAKFSEAGFDMTLVVVLQNLDTIVQGQFGQISFFIHGGSVIDQGDHLFIQRIRLWFAPTRLFDECERIGKCLSRLKKLKNKKDYWNDQMRTQGTNE